MNNTVDSFADMIRFILNKLEINHQKLAEMLGVNKSDVYCMENNCSNNLTLHILTGRFYLLLKELVDNDLFDIYADVFKRLSPLEMFNFLTSETAKRDMDNCVISNKFTGFIL